MHTYAKQNKRWQSQVIRIARSGFYANTRKAEIFFEQNLAPVWRRRSDAEVLSPIPTEMLIIHLFARGLLGVDAASAPQITVSPPSHEVGENGLPILRTVIPTSDIGRMIGRSRKAVDEALKAFRRSLRYAGAVRVLSFPSGVALDGWLSPNAKVPFMYSATDYVDAREYAGNRDIKHTRFVRTQRGWCKAAIVFGHRSAPRRADNDELRRAS